MKQKYIELLADIWYKNRVHNGPEMDYCVDRLTQFCQTNLRGKVIINTFTPGDIYNHWIIPPHWSVKHFSLKDSAGNVLATHSDHPLVVCPYSQNFQARVSLEELRRHVISRPDRPTAYSFYFRQMYRHWEPGWRISLPQDVIENLAPGDYEVDLQTERSDLPMKVFEYVLDGETSDTIYIAAHLDHPGMINDSLSGCLASLEILDQLETIFPKTRYTYRVLLVPEIIGTAVYLKRFEDRINDAIFSFCPNMTSHDADLALCLSKNQDSLLDIAFQKALLDSKERHVVAPFHTYPDCGDEISFDTVGYDIPSTTLSRIGEKFTRYHSSDDSLENFVQADWQKRHDAYVENCIKAFTYIEQNVEMIATFAGNPCLSNPDIDLYLDPVNINNLSSNTARLLDAKGNQIDPRNFMEFFLDALGRDLKPSVLEIAWASGLPFQFVANYTAKFAEKGLVKVEPTRRKRIVRTVGTTNLKVPELLTH